MLDSADKHLFIYVVARDFGFAPNPFHGCCSLATCKPDIRRSADLGDWVMGVGGSRLKATGRCIYLMEVTEVTTYDQYWNDERFLVKRPLRNGSSVMMVVIISITVMGAKVSGYKRIRTIATRMALRIRRMCRPTPDQKESSSQGGSTTLAQLLPKLISHPLDIRMCATSGSFPCPRSAYQPSSRLWLSSTQQTRTG